MYIPKHFEEVRVDVMHKYIDAHPFATLITMKEGSPEANHIPMILIGDSGVPAALNGHLARANTLWQEHPANVDVLAIFQGPASYITPSWYASKAEAGKVVPTWNYVSVQARGRIRFIEDEQWLLQHLQALTIHNEKAFANPWQVSDAPPEYISQMLHGIVGFEIEISELKGKWKISQNRTDQDKQTLVKGLAINGCPEMAALILPVENNKN